MSYCFNPDCPKPQNPIGTKNFCTSCGSKLLFRNRYHSIQPLGAGGFGKTFLAMDAERIDAPCVIKQFFPAPDIQASTQGMAKATELFEQEAKQLLQLGEQHPQIPTLFAYFEQDKCLYLVQQYIEGQDLGQELQQGAFSEEQIRELLNDLLPVLQFIHAHNVIHRDIKPTNILRKRSPLALRGAQSHQPLLSTTNLVLIDFGVSKQLTVRTSLTKTGTKTGTEGYAPLEQLRSGKAYPASDLYSLGVTCIQLLTAAELDELYDSFEGKWIWREYLKQKGKDVSEQLSQILEKLVKDYVKDRYQSAEDALKDLSTAINQHLQTSYAQKSLTPTQVKQPVPQPLTPPKPQVWKCTNTLKDHSDAVMCVAISPNGQTIASASTDSRINIWQLDSLKLIFTVNPYSTRFYSVAFSPDGRTLASGSKDNSIKTWDVASRTLLKIFDGHSSPVYSLVISADGQTLVSGSHDTNIMIWQLNNQQIKYYLKGHSGVVYSVAISLDGQILASGSADQTIRIWHLHTGKLLHTLAGHINWVNSVAISPDGQTLVSGSADNTIKIWKINSGQLLHTLDGHSDWVNSVAISPNGQTIVSGSGDHTIKIWQLDSGKLLQTLNGHSNWVYSVAITPDGQTIVSGSEDKTIKVWRCD